MRVHDGSKGGFCGVQEGTGGALASPGCVVPLCMQCHTAPHRLVHGLTGVMKIITEAGPKPG